MSSASGMGEAAVIADSQQQIERFKAELLSLGYLTHERSARAEVYCRETGDSFLVILNRLGLCSDEQIAEAAARITGFKLVRSGDLPSEGCFKTVFRKEFLLLGAVAPLSLRGDVLELGSADPFNKELFDLVGFKTGKQISPVIVPRGELLEWIEKTWVVETEQPDDEGSDFQPEADLERLKDLAGGAPVVRWVKSLLAEAAEVGASDVHLDPTENGLDVRFRIDGQLKVMERPKGLRADAVVSRIKILARLNIAERRLPQDGRIRTAVNGREIDLRVATLSTLHGESVVMRLLDRSANHLTLDKLGFLPSALQRFRAALGRPDGIILVTGPTGSGKTTTLYAALREMLTPEAKFISVEDPVEYEVAGVTQVQVKPEIGLGFSTTLRSLLRHDPNVIMIGEIRDVETASIAMEASLTGHQVLSTLHTNSSVATLTRLIEMGVQDYLLASTLRMITAQRLVRRLCRNCRAPIDPPVGLLESFSEPVEQLDFAAPQGCAMCNHTGYSGRLSLTEVLPITATIRDAIVRRSPESKIQEIARAEGMLPLFETGIQLASSGETSVEEVARVAMLERG